MPAWFLVAEASVVSPSISNSASSSHHQQIALFTATNRPSGKTSLKTLRSGGGGDLSFSDVFQQHLVVKCIFYCLTFIDKISCNTFHALLQHEQKVAWGYVFVVTLYTVSDGHQPVSFEGKHRNCNKLQFQSDLPITLPVVSPLCYTYSSDEFSIL